MATLIPTLGAARFDARGELRLAERLKDCLEDNAWVWHNIPVGPFGRHPDFVALHPQQGIVVLEVKDWRLDTIGNASSKQVERKTEGQVFHYHFASRKPCALHSCNFRLS